MQYFIVFDIHLTKIVGTQQLRKAESQFTYFSQNCPTIISENEGFQQIVFWKDF